MNDLDLIVLGGFYGEGRKSGMVSKFLVGLASETTKKNGMPSEFLSLGLASTGLTDENIKTLQERLKPHWQDKKPNGVDCPKVIVHKNNFLSVFN